MFQQKAKSKKQKDKKICKNIKKQKGDNLFFLNVAEKRQKSYKKMKSKKQTIYFLLKAAASRSRISKLFQTTH